MSARGGSRAARRCLAAAALAAWALAGTAGAAHAELRRLEVVGAVPVEAGAAPSRRQAALQAALAEAALQAARSLFEAEAGKPPPPDLGAVIGTPEDYAVSYRVVEDRGEQPALLTAAGPDAREYVVVAEVQVDVGRLRDRLRERGRLAGEPPAPAAPTRFRLELLDVPSPGAYEAIRTALAAAGGTLLPLELEPRRALVEVSGLSEAVAVERLRTAVLASELWVEPLPPGEAGAPARLRVHRGAPPGPPVELEQPAGDDSQAPPEAAREAPASEAAPDEPVEAPSGAATN